MVKKKLRGAVRKARRRVSTLQHAIKPRRGPSEAPLQEVLRHIRDLGENQTKLFKEVQRLHASLGAASLLHTRLALRHTHERAFLRDLLAATAQFRGKHDPARFVAFLNRYLPRIDSISELLYERLDEPDRRIFLQWMLKRHAKIDILEPEVTEEYEALLARIKRIPTEHRMTVGDKTYPVKNLSSLGYDVSFSATSTFVFANDFYLQQYSHKDVYVRTGDVAIDAGAYTGDTALVFAHNTDYRCDIHCFELSDANLACFRENLGLNPRLAKLVTMNRLALTDRSDEVVHFQVDDARPVFSGLKLSQDATGERVTTVTIDDYVERKSLPRVDFIKMDIEGGEPAALEGARRTIRTFKPRLAISLYHRWDDPFIIPQLIHDMHDDYVLYFNWYNKRMANEAVLYAIDREELQERNRVRTDAPPAAASGN